MPQLVPISCVFFSERAFDLAVPVARVVPVVFTCSKNTEVWRLIA
jgi:hypothetical protein